MNFFLKNKYIKFFLIIIIFPFWNIFYLISLFIPKKKNLWLFGAGTGTQYNDNTKYFFEYISLKKKKIKAIWLTHSNEILKHVRSKGLVCYKIYSFKGFYLSLKADLSFVSTHWRDLNHFLPNKKTIQLWHGSPIKKIYNDDSRIIEKRELFLKKVIKFFFPYLKTIDDYFAIIASSKDERKNLSSGFNLSLEKIHITGLPRNQNFNHIKSGLSKTKTNLRAIYLPTWRQINHDEFINSFQKLNFAIRKYKNIFIDIKLHPYNFSLLKNINVKNPRISIIKNDFTNDDLHAYLNDYDILITDYSSIFFDFLLTKKPIIIFAPDHDMYLKYERNFYYKFDEIKTTSIFTDWGALLGWISCKGYNDKKYIKKYNHLLKRFHNYDKKDISNNLYKSVEMYG